MTKIKKLLLAFSLFTLLLSGTLSFLTPPAHAQETWYSQGFDTWYSRVYDNSNPDEVFGERYTAASVQWILYSLISNSINLVIPPPFRPCAVDAFKKGRLNLVECSYTSLKEILIPDLTVYQHQNSENFFTKVLNSPRPISGIAYIKQKANKLNPVQEVSAQGYGFETTLSPIQKIWSAFRNVTYVLMIFAVIALSFMIMFRVKTSPQTAMNVQSALVKLVIALIAITFSYAIAGLLIDLVYVVIGLVALVFANSGLFIKTGWTYFFNMMTEGPPLIINIGSAGIFGYVTQYLVAFAVAGLAAALSIFSPFTGGTVSQEVAGLVFGVIIFFVVIIAFFIMIVVVLIACLRILWMMFKTFATILMLVIFAPFILLFGTFVPGLGLGNWIRMLLANLAVFPVVGVLYFIALLFTGGAYSSISGAAAAGWILNVFAIPAVQEGTFTRVQDGATLPLLGGGQLMPIVWLAVGFMVFSMIPKTANMIKSMLEGKPFSYGLAIGETTSTAWNLLNRDRQDKVKKGAGDFAKARATNTYDFINRKVLKRL